MKISKDWKFNAKVSNDEYNLLYSESIKENDNFWNKHGKRINWIKDYTKIKK